MSRDRERGSALLIVFLFAAIVAIMLYTELPVAVFEARRQKEQLLVGRGEEYAHAVKLYVRKFGRYPASIDQLENTNRMRFLRHRFKDPFTGKDDWRLLHADPNGALVDSKVKNINQLGAQGTKSGTNSGSGSNSGFGSGSSFASNSGFGSNSGSSSNSSFASNSGFGSSASNSNSSFGSSGSFTSSSNTPPEVIVPPVRRRGAVVPSNGALTEETQTSTAETQQQDPTVPLMPSGQAEQLQQADEVAGNTAGQTQGANGTGQTGLAAGQSTGSGQPNSTQSGQSVATAVANAPSGGAAAQPQRFASATGQGTGMISSGGIAGVASKAGGKTIKLVNDQKDYSLWEFYYDPRKDLAGGMTAMTPGGQPQTGAPAVAPQSPNSGAFGSTTGAAPAPQNPAAAPQNPQEGAGAGSQPQEPQQQEPQQPESQEPQDPQ